MNSERIVKRSTAKVRRTKSASVELGDMTPGEVAKLVGVTTHTLVRWARAGHGPRRVQFGLRLARYNRAEVERWLADLHDGTPQA